jgi:hypothetical protein
MFLDINLPFLYTLHLNVLFDGLLQTSLFDRELKYIRDGFFPFEIMNAHNQPIKPPTPREVANCPKE